MGTGRFDVPLPVPSMSRVACLCFFLVFAGTSPAGANVVSSYRDQIEPLVMTYCFDCHGDGMDKGEVDLDPANLEEHLGDLELWKRVWHNLRSQLMPPADKDQPLPEETAKLTRWIEREVFRLDPENPDPGHVTIRRLNRVEYRYTVEDLLGARFPVEDHFPPDDAGYGFENVGDVLSLSPLLMEKYLEAARLIVEEAVPTGGRIPQRRVWGSEFKAPQNPKQTARHLPFARERTVQVRKWVEHAGRYRFRVAFRTSGSEEATENTAKLVLLANGRELGSKVIGWDTRREISFSAGADLSRGHAELALRLEPQDPPEHGEKALFARVDRVDVTGPLDGSVLEYSDAYRRIFVDGPPPEASDSAGRRAYARKILQGLASRAYRRPVDEEKLSKLVDIVMITDRQPDHGFEHGIRQALAAVLASSGFLFRAEAQPSPDDPAEVVWLEEFALASRLSYFLWCSLPDEELFRQAQAGTLRENLHAQVERMLRDPKAKRFTRDFTGQWLSARDVATIHVNARAVLGTDSRREAARLFNRDLRQRMREETELFFHHVLLEGRPAEDLLIADYTFLNGKLAEFYGIDGVKGRKMRRVDLPPGSHRGGILRQASFHIVTSNPSRTSPVKRGLFVLENLLGTPAPPAPPDVPALEEAKKAGKGPQTMREMMEMHRAKPLCTSCHARMDPIGLALENYNAIGLWRDKEDGKPLDTSGKLITGETFSSADELVEILATERRKDFYRCLAEKLLTYALGRGVEYFDGPTIDEIVRRMDANRGSLREAVFAVIESVPFQKRRGHGSRSRLSEHATEQGS